MRGRGKVPGSSNTGKKEIKEWFDTELTQRPLKIIDFGCGEGTYVKLLGKEGIHWTGVEIWAPYVREFKLDELYDVLIVGDLLKMDWPEADCAIFGDVLEHLPSMDAILTILRADRKYRHVILSVPIYNSQGPTENPNEEHKYWWQWEELGFAVPMTFPIRKKLGDPALVPGEPLMGVFIK